MTVKEEDTNIILVINRLQPICCKYCTHYTNFITYIPFDLEHLFETHNIRSDYTIKNAINEGKKLGATLDDDSMQKLDLEYSKHSEKDKTQPSVQDTTHENVVSVMEGIIPWSQHAKGLFNFAPIVSVDKFFQDDYNKSYAALRDHPLEQSPCYPIIGVKTIGRNILYYCEICQPEFANDSTVANTNLSSLEHHCKYRKPERHKSEILARLEGRAGWYDGYTRVLQDRYHSTK